ncbi:hypothetical protein ACJ73_01246 [Blastomyces percursus]|uniref:Uncharacterized protein n=1 Tax=Blastomyces percursus TaxID=1658174 RepID=A0A1J9QGZ4_9EURO|nr:hypothetical protein ACJ73_01246 [Blastomyces percursus]
MAATSALDGGSHEIPQKPTWTLAVRSFHCASSLAERGFQDLLEFSIELSTSGGGLLEIDHPPWMQADEETAGSCVDGKNWEGRLP